MSFGGIQFAMVNFICQLDWVTVPRYLIKHISEYVYEGFSG